MTHRATRRRDPARQLRLWLPVVLYVSLIAFMSSRPRLTPPFRFMHSDKVSHVLEYGVLGVLLGRAFGGSLPAAPRLAVAGLAVGTGVCIGVGDEFLQSFVPGRESTVTDVMADAAGLVLAQWLVRPAGVRAPAGGAA